MNTKQNIDSGIISKIQKLLALGQSSNKHEAELAIANANKLLTKYNLSLFDVQNQNGMNMQATQKDIQLGSRVASWKKNLIAILCEYNYCTSIIRRQGNGENFFIIVGAEVNIMTVLNMYAYLIETIDRLTAKSNTKGVTEKNSFRMGMVHGINMKLEETKHTIIENGIDEECTALMVIDVEKRNKEMIQNYLSENFQRLSTAKQSRSNIDGRAFLEGVSAGRNVNLNKQISG